jgi:hypothetical protein
LLVDYLKQHKVLVFEGQDDLGQNEAFEHLARHMGQHFDVLAPFYEKMKRAVATGKTSRIDIENYSEPERSAAVQLGTLLYRHGMLKDFYYHRSPKRQLRVIPNKDGEIQQFLTGGWLEIYVVWLLTRRLRARMNTSKYQVMFNVKGTLPDEREFESDLMACIDGRLLWLECKTGQWQDYSARFRGLVKTFGTDRKGAGLVLIKPPDGSTRARATDMLDMTLLSLAQVGEFMDDFLGVPLDERVSDDERPARPTRGGRARGGRSRSEERSSTDDRDDRSSRDRGRDRDRSGGRDPGDRTASLPEGMIAPRPDDQVPLENPEPAKKLGKVDLESGGTPATEEDIPRRRRRRRGGRGRGGNGGGSSEGRSSEDRPSALREELPVEPLTEEQEASRAAQTERGEASNQRGSETNAEGEDRPRRRRGSRGGRGRKRKPEGEAREEQSGDEPESEFESETEVVEQAASRDQSEARDEPASEDSPESDDRETRTRSRKRSAKPRSRREASSSDTDAGEPEAPVAEAEEAKPRRKASRASKPKEVEEEPAAAKDAPLIPDGMVVKRVDSPAAAKPSVRRKPALPKVERVEREERKGSVIAPDLSAMMAGGAKSADAAQDADEAEEEN